MKVYIGAECREQEKFVLGDLVLDTGEVYSADGWFPIIHVDHSKPLALFICTDDPTYVAGYIRYDEAFGYENQSRNGADKVALAKEFTILRKDAIKKQPKAKKQKYPQLPKRRRKQ